MSKKSDLVAALIKEVKLRYPMPSGPAEGLNLLEQGAVIVLMRHMTQRQAETSVKALKGAYEDWNEIRVCQAQEISESLRHGGRKKGVALLHDRREAAMALKEYLQDVYQQTDHLDLEELREEPQTAGKAGMSLEVLGNAGASYLMFLASDGQVPVHLPLIKLLDRLGLIPKTTSLKKARASVDGLIGKGQELSFTLAIHEVLELWEDDDQPIYMTVPCLQATDYGKKSFKDRSSAIAKAEVARKREEERVRKEEERERKRAEAEAKKRARELERKRVAEEKKLAVVRAKAAAADARRKEAEARRADAARKKETARKQAAAKKVAAKKAADKKIADKKAAAKKAAAKKAAAKKVAAKKAAAKKVAAKKAAGAKKKAASKKPAAKKKAAKKPAAKKKAAKKAPSKKKAPAKKKAAKKPASKKKAAKKPAAKKAAARKPAAKKAAKKPASKKASAKKKASKKPAAKKKAASRRR